MPRRQEIGRKKFDRDVQTIRTKFPQWVYLAAPLTSASWAGDSFSTTAKTLLDLSAVFAVPAGVRAILANAYVRDSASNGANYQLILAPNNTANQGFFFDAEAGGNDVYRHTGNVVPCDANGDVYYQISASGADTLDIWLHIWGYAI